MSTTPVFAVVGHVNKGKSSVVATLAEDDSVRIEREAGTTRECASYTMEVEGRKLFTLIDTPGFEQARHALAWMREREKTGSAADRPRVLEEFVRVHAPAGAFPEECKLLAPVLGGAGILYVVDGSRPFSATYEAEMEILRWTGRPRMALVNRIGARDHMAEWRAALDQYFGIVRPFNAHAAGYRERIHLLQAFRELREEWRPAMDRAISLLEAERDRRSRQSARAIADMVADEITLTREKRLALEEDAEPFKGELERSFLDELRRRERACREEIEDLYRHRRIRRCEVDLALFDEDLFSESTWLRLGLDRMQLTTTGAVGGALAGGAIDLAVGGASFFLGSLIGGAIGAASGWLSRAGLAKAQVLGQPLGGKLLRIGPVRTPQFAWILTDRALLHQKLVSERAHAVRSEILIEPERGRGGIVASLDPGRRRALERCFARIRKTGDVAAAERSRQDLGREIEALLAWEGGPGPDF